MKCNYISHYDNIWSMGECASCGENAKDIKDLKKELNISNKDIADFFDMSYGAFANSTAKKRYERALVRFYQKIKKQE